MTRDIKFGNFNVSLSFALNDDKLKEDILCNEDGDFLIADSDFVIANRQVSFEQEFADSLHLRLYEDLFDPLYGSNIHKFNNAVFNSTEKLLLKKELASLLEKNEKIDSSTIEIEISRA